MTLAPVQPGCCVVCRMAETGAGYAPGGKRRRLPGEFKFTCDDDIGLAKAVAHMKAPILNRVEGEAIDAAGAKAGQYLDAIGKTDLAMLTPEEWQTFLETFLNGFGEEMRDRLAAHQAPF